MKELLNLACNFAASIDDQQRLRPQIELIFIASEPRYRVDAIGETVRERQIETARFFTTPQHARKLGKVLLQLAEDAEQEFAAAASKLTPNTQQQGGAA